MDQATFHQQHGDLGFYWLSAARDRAEAHSRGLTLFGKQVYEADADFKGGKPAGLTVSIYNRGDAGDMTREQMTAAMEYTVRQLSTLTKAPAVDEGEEASDAVKAHAFSWRTPVSKFMLEYSFTKEVNGRAIPFRAEFIRLRVMPAEKPKSFMEEALAPTTAQAAFDGPSHVKKDASGDVRIDGIPMVDQGQKGYCVVATAERVMRYYGVAVDEHEMAELANSSATEGTSNAAMVDSLKKLSQRLQVKVRLVEEMNVRQFLDLVSDYNRRAQRARQAEISVGGPVIDLQQIYMSMKPEILKDSRTHNQADVDRFLQMVEDHIDQGIPVLWSVVLGILPEPKEPKGVGGHMRLIIGYNLTTREILYSDPWGPGHELKRMPADDAWTMTTAMDSIEPL